ncbi:MULTISPECIES: hypothetical protein [Cloacibacterium]|jgi:hypothetical protein|uniref:Lipoprotein n=1 Tax=Cloacibacterium normanense TaxID=237258 RepID=A0A2S7I8S9_9FLAO|nr:MULTISPECIES: hypothetical protein [Cloacibacterium]PPZ92953.1 hypothetical protein C3729_02825 [Cloacibacterium normanense]
MKKIILLSVSALSVLFVSCRQNEDILSNEDIQTLNIIQKNRDLRELNNKNKKDTISIKTQVLRTDSLSTVLSFDEIVKPPR